MPRPQFDQFSVASSSRKRIQFVRFPTGNTHPATGNRSSVPKEEVKPLGPT